MKFLVDNQLPPRLASHLRSRGHEVEHVAEIGMERRTDVEIWDRAAEAGQGAISKDEDFVFLARTTTDASFGFDLETAGRRRCCRGSMKRCPRSLRR
jgi:predicted nuclease of predicted toxin-antitoxin system